MQDLFVFGDAVTGLTLGMFLVFPRGALEYSEIDEVLVWVLALSISLDAPPREESRPLAYFFDLLEPCEDASGSHCKFSL